MELPLRILRERPPQPVVTVDGALGANGLELSHWPGNRTPAALKHELSTGCALLFARLDDADRRRLAGDATALVNNHYDTDGVLASFAVRHPRLALAHAKRLLDAADCGDFYRIPDMQALAIDATVTAFADRERSPLARDFAGSDDWTRYELAQEQVHAELPTILGGDLSPHRHLWEPVLDAANADLSDLRDSSRREYEDSDLTTWTAQRQVASSRRGAATYFDPGRHALFGSSEAEHVLAIGPRRTGCTWRLVLSTRSWFDVPGREPRPRPDLELLTQHLNELEGSRPSDELAWRTQPSRSPAPELWFGRASTTSFSEHSNALRPSQHDPAVVRALICEALEH